MGVSNFAKSTGVSPGDLGTPFARIETSKAPPEGSGWRVSMAWVRASEHTTTPVFRMVAQMTLSTKAVMRCASGKANSGNSDWKRWCSSPTGSGRCVVCDRRYRRHICQLTILEEEQWNAHGSQASAVGQNTHVDTHLSPAAPSCTGRRSGQSTCACH